MTPAPTALDALATRRRGRRARRCRRPRRGRAPRGRRRRVDPGAATGWLAAVGCTRRDVRGVLRGGRPARGGGGRRPRTCSPGSSAPRTPSRTRRRSPTSCRAACDLGPARIDVIARASATAAVQRPRSTARRRGATEPPSAFDLPRVDPSAFDLSALALPPLPDAGEPDLVAGPRRRSATPRRTTFVPAPDEKPAKTLEELLAELDALVGLDRVKARDPPADAAPARRAPAHRGRADRADADPAPGVPGQPRDRQDDGRAPGRRDLPGARAADQGAPGRGRPLGARRRLPRADRREDVRGRRDGPRRCAVRRRGVRPGRGPVRRRGGEHAGQGHGGPPRRPRGDRRRATPGRWRRSSPPTPGWRAGSPRRSSSTTTPTPSCARSSPATADQGRLRADPRVPDAVRGAGVAADPRRGLRQRSLRPQRAGPGDHPARLAAAGR